MFSRHNIGRFFAAFLPIFFLIGSFSVIKIITHIDAQADDDCDGRVPEVRDTPRAPRYCPDGGGQTINSTSEYAWFYYIGEGENVEQWWYVTQYWVYEDGIYCSVNVTHEMLRDWTDGGFWSGSESKWLSWLEDDDDDDDNDFVVNLSSDALRYNGVDTDGDDSIDIICPYFRQDFEAYQRCDFVGDDDAWARDNWHGWDWGTDYVENVVTADELEDHIKADIPEEELQDPNLRWGEQSGESFSCYEFGSSF